MADDVTFMPATRLLALYRKKQLSPVEIVQDALRRIEAQEGSRFELHAGAPRAVQLIAERRLPSSSCARPTSIDMSEPIAIQE